MNPSESPGGAAATPGWLGRLVPALGWLRGYDLSNLRPDLVAGITLAAYLLPAGLGDASLANLPVQAGLYACLFSGLVFWAFCSSRHTAITVTSAISLLVGASLGDLAGGDPTRFWALATCTALMVATMSLIAYLLRAGALINFVSETVLVGFKSGVALYLASTQLPKLCGFSGSHGDFWERSHHFIANLGSTNYTALALGVSSLAALALGKRFLANRPVAFFVVVLGIAISALAGLADLGVKMLGEVPSGLPALGLPAVQLQDINELLPLAMACFLLAAVETAAIGRTFSQKYGYRLDSNQEFLAIAAANLAAGLGRGYPVSGGMSQSLVNENGGARTPLSGLLAAAVILVVVLFFSGLLRDLPQPVLAAIVLFAVTGLFKLEALKRLWRFNRGEFLVAMAALMGVLGSGLLRGVLIGAVLSILMLLRRGSTPYTAEIGRVPGTSHFADLLRHPENERQPDVLVFRVDAALLYFNVDYVRDRLEEAIAARGHGLKLVIFFLGTTPAVDLAGADLLEELRHAFEKRGMEFRLAEARGTVREALQRAGFGGGGPLPPHQTVEQVIDTWRADRRAGG
jgi:high affinity sulfate transporter 1